MDGRTEQSDAFSILVADTRGSQKDIQDATVLVHQDMNCEAKVLADAVFFVVGSLFPQEAHSSVTHRFTQGNRFAIQEVNTSGHLMLREGGERQTPDEFPHRMKTGDEARITAQLRERLAVIVRDMLIGLLESGAS